MKLFIKLCPEQDRCNDHSKEKQNELVRRMACLSFCPSSRETRGRKRRIYALDTSSFFAEAKTPSVFLTLSATRYRRQLDCDLRFLHMLLHSCIDKINLYSTYDATAPTIEERVLLHTKENYPSYELDGIEAAVLQLRCSRRQLQRVLKKLCDNGKIKKTGRGRYKLSE